MSLHPSNYVRPPPWANHCSPVWPFFPGWSWGVHPPAGASGAGLRQGVVGLGDRLWVGEPGRLSLEDRDWWRPEEKLRLVCSTDDCFEIFLKSDFRLGVRNPDSSQVPPLCPGLPKHAVHPRSAPVGAGPCSPVLRPTSAPIGAAHRSPVLLPASAPHRGRPTVHWSCVPHQPPQGPAHRSPVLRPASAPAGAGPLLTVLCPASAPAGPAHRSPVLRLPPSAPLAPARHAALGHVLPGGAHLDGRVLQRCGPKGNLVATLQEGWRRVASVPPSQ